jgi:hypothetical protein
MAGLQRLPHERHPTLSYVLEGAGLELALGYVCQRSSLHAEQSANLGHPQPMCRVLIDDGEKPGDRLPVHSIDDARNSFAYGLLESDYADSA